jgi:hypothetical protein
VSSRTYAYELHATEPGLKAGAGDSFLSGEQIRAGLRELHMDPGSMLPEPSFGNRQIESRDIFIRASSSLEERSVDLLYMKPAILHGLDRVGDLDQLAGGFLWLGIAALSGEFHQAVSRCAQRTWSGTSPTVRLAPQKQVDRPSVDCVGSRYPVSHMRYFQAVKAYSARHSWKSDSVRFDRNTRHASSNSTRAWSKVAAVPWVSSLR